MWADVDFESGLIRVRYQLDRRGHRVEPKTPQSKRDVELMPALVKRLREHKLASPYSQPDDFVFASETGGPLYFRNVSRRGPGKAVKDAKLAAPKPRFHDLRHTATSLLIAEGLNVVYVAQQMGHVDAGFTLRVYGHLFARAEHASRANAALEARYGAMV